MPISLKVNWKDVFKALGLGQIAIQKIEERGIIVTFQTDKVVMKSLLGPQASVPIPAGAITLAVKGNLQPMSKQNAAQKISSSLNQLCKQVDELEKTMPTPLKKKKYHGKLKPDAQPTLIEASAMYQEVIPIMGYGSYKVVAIGDGIVLAVQYLTSNPPGQLSLAFSGTGAGKYSEALVGAGFKPHPMQTYTVWQMTLACGSDIILARRSIGAVMFGLGPNIFHSPYPNLDSICA
ncbi:MAG: hypothetical protein V3T23_11440 [Nitrososphaerales archaeon]